jgi:hypothetical protein
MNAVQIVYLLIFIFAIYFIYLSFKNKLKYKKENIKPLFYLDNDDKIRHIVSSAVIIFVVIVAVFLIINSIRVGIFNTEMLFLTVVFPVLMVLLYIPIIKKTMVSTLGIHKRGTLIRWGEIKAVNYFKPNKKDQVKVKIVYTYAGRDISTGLTFGKDDPQLGAFKKTVKEYRKSSKKGSKNDR